jgi:hypothetical protein
VSQAQNNAGLRYHSNGKTALIDTFFCVLNRTAGS